MKNKTTPKRSSIFIHIVIRNPTYCQFSADTSFRYLALRDFEMCHLKSFIKIIDRVVVLHGEIIRIKRVCFFHGKFIYEISRQCFFFWNITYAKFQSQIYKQGNNSKTLFFQSFTRNSTHHPLIADKFEISIFDTFRDTALTELHYDFFQRAIFLQGEKIRQKICTCYFSMRNPYIKFQDYISNERMHANTQAWT